jgi:hypothetical protein
MLYIVHVYMAFGMMMVWQEFSRKCDNVVSRNAVLLYWDSTVHAACSLHVVCTSSEVNGERPVREMT